MTFSQKKYLTRSTIRKAENTVDRLRQLFQGVDDFMKEGHEDEVKKAVMEEMTMWQGGEESVKKDMAEVLLKHLARRESEKVKSKTVESSRPDEKTAKIVDKTTHDISHSNTKSRPSATPVSTISTSQMKKSSTRLSLPGRRLSSSSVAVAKEIMKRYSMSSTCPNIPEEVETIAT